MYSNVVMKDECKKNDFKLVVGKNRSEITVEELAEDIESLVLYDGASFKVTEEFDKPKRCCSYLLYDLSMEIEDGYVCCSDSFNMLSNNFYVLMGFLKENILKIYRTIIDDTYCEKIILSDGIITIETVFD